MTIDDESYSDRRPWESVWGRPERTELIDENLLELRRGPRVLLVCDVKQMQWGVGDDGTAIMVDHRVVAHLDDELYEAMNWCRP